MSSKCVKNEKMAYELQPCASIADVSSCRVLKSADVLLNRGWQHGIYLFLYYELNYARILIGSQL